MPYENLYAQTSVSETDFGWAIPSCCAPVLAALALTSPLVPQPGVLARRDLQALVKFQLNIPELPIVISFIVSCSWLVHISGLLVFQARTVYP